MSQTSLTEFKYLPHFPPLRDYRQHMFKRVKSRIVLIVDVIQNVFALFLHYKMRVSEILSQVPGRTNILLYCDTFFSPLECANLYIPQVVFS